jgi:methyltransferase-like protein
VLLEPLSTPPRLDEPVRRMAELARGNANACTFNIWHETLRLSPVDGHLLPLLDGTRDRDALVEALLEFDRGDLIRFERDGQRLTGPERRDAAAACIDGMPQRLASMKLWQCDNRTW